MFSLSLLPLKCVQWIFDAWHNYIHINKYQGIRKLIADWLPTARQTQQKRESKREQKLRFCWLSNATSYKFIIPSNLYYILTVYAVHSIERYWLCMKSKRDKRNVSREDIHCVPHCTVRNFFLSIFLCPSLLQFRMNLSSIYFLFHKVHEQNNESYAIQMIFYG